MPGLLAEIAAAGPVDAVVIACFDDTGLAEARAIAGCPVIGIGEAAFHAAMLIGARFSVVTTLAVSVPVIEANLAAYGLASACVRVRASGVPVLGIENAEGAERISAEIARAVAEDGVSAHRARLRRHGRSRRGDEAAAWRAGDRRRRRRMRHGPHGRGAGLSLC